MKKTEKILVLIILYFLFQFPCAFAQNNYSNAAIALYNSGVVLHKQGKYELAAQKYNQALKIQPNFVEAKQNLGVTYQNLAYKCYETSEYEKSLVYAEKAIAFNPKNIDVYHTMGQCYSSLKDYNNAIAIYNKILSNNPDDKVAQNNLEFVSLQHIEKKSDIPISNLTTEHTASPRLYKLIKPAPGIPAEDVETMKTVLDLVWSDPSGRIILETFLDKKISVNIIWGQAKANATQIKNKRTLYAYGIIPVFSFTTTSNFVNIPVKYINNFSNPNVSAHEKIYNLQVFIHEFGHAFIGAKNKNRINSMEEELGVSMLGYNISSKILAGQYLDEKETEIYSKNCLQALLSDEHKELPVFSGFNRAIQSYGVVLPYPEAYTDIVAVYKKLLSENKTPPVSSFYKYMR